MKNYIAFCGLDCETCEARMATIHNNDALRKKVAKRWSELNGVEITPEMINCTGCRIDGVETCGDCAEMKSCEKLGAITGNNTDALRRLKTKA